MRSLGQGVKNFKEGMHEKSEPEDESLLEKTEVTAPPITINSVVPIIKGCIIIRILNKFHLYQKQSPNYHFRYFPLILT